MNRFDALIDSIKKGVDKIFSTKKEIPDEPDVWDTGQKQNMWVNTTHEGNANNECYDCYDCCDDEDCCEAGYDSTDVWDTGREPDIWRN